MNENTSVFDNLDPDITKRIFSRRESLATMGKMGMVAAVLGSIPVTFAAFSQKAFGQSSQLPQGVIDVLNYALTLEFLESEFYIQGLAAGVVPAGDRAMFEQVRKHEVAHVAFLQQALGNKATEKPNFKFDKVFTDVFTNVQTFMVVAQAFEDTGVRAYKGRAGELMVAPDILEAALRIHSVEARHAAAIRRLRGQKGWITGQDGGNMPSSTAAVYAGENTLNGSLGSLSNAAVTEAFDEPLGPDTVLQIAANFIA